jgi:hypothetical protein
METTSQTFSSGNEMGGKLTRHGNSHGRERLRSAGLGLCLKCGLWCCASVGELCDLSITLLVGMTAFLVDSLMGPYNV